jgi:N-acetylneuraminic acid mutarotase
MYRRWAFDPTSYSWAYFGGSASQTVQGNYVDKGSPSASAHPAPRGSAASWVDSDGKFWMFAGETAINTFTQVNYLSDLWMFDPDTSTWTWVGGPAMPTTNQAGVYGTKGKAESSNWPGSRTSAMFWADASGLFWLFGGEGFDMQGNFGMLNDLWKFSPVTKEWTWISGSSARDAAGVYGEIRKVDSSGVISPSARSSGFMYGQKTDSNGFNIWLIGGEGASAYIPNFPAPEKSRHLNCGFLFR